MEKAVKKQSQSQSKRWMQILNIVFFGALLGVQVVYSVDWQTGFEGIVTTSMIRLCVEIFVKGILLFLCIQFGSNVTVKSFLYSTGELVIIGTDPDDKEVFKLLLNSYRVNS